MEAAEHDRAAQAVQATRLREEVDVLRKQVGGRALGGWQGQERSVLLRGRLGGCLPGAQWLAAGAAAARAAVRWPHV